MRTIFHVGHHKTGSSTLQSVMEASRDALLRRGVLYPRNPNGEYVNHRLLFTDLFAPSEVPRHVLKNYALEALPAARDELVRSVRAEVDAHRPECLVLSSESRFRRLGEAQRHAFKAMLAEIGAGNTEIVAYIRRPSSWYLSSLQQRIRASHLVKPPSVMNLSAAVAQFVEDFGREAVHLRPFDRRALVRGDIVDDFVETFLAPHGVRAEDLVAMRDRNASPTAEGTDLLRRFRLDFHPDEANRFLPDSKALMDHLARVEEELDLPRAALDPGLAEAIDYSSRHLLRLRDEHGLVLPDYDYERLERGDLSELPDGELPLERIVRIDRAAQGAVVERLRASSWARRDEARATWLDALAAEISGERGGLRPGGGDGRPAGAPEADAGARRSWDEAVSGRDPLAIGDLWRPEPLAAGDAVAALGGPVARRVGPALEARGLRWIGDPPGRGCDPADGAHSAPTGDIPTATLLALWTRWALGGETPPGIVRRARGRVHDPLRPGAAPRGFASRSRMLSARAEAVEAFGHAVRKAHAVLIELGSTEALHDEAAGVEVPEAGAVKDPSTLRAEIQDVAEVRAALTGAVEAMRAANPGLRVILSVSPEMPAATLTRRHVLVAGVESKAVMRAAMAEVARTVPGVDYFPALEMIAGPQARGALHEADLRRVSRSGAAQAAEALAAALAPRAPGPSRTAGGEAGTTGEGADARPVGG